MNFNDVDDNGMASNAGNPMDNDNVDMTEGSSGASSSDEAGSEVAMPGGETPDADSENNV